MSAAPRSPAKAAAPTARRRLLLLRGASVPLAGMGAEPISRTLLPKRTKRPKASPDLRSCPGHRAWVRSYRCCVLGCTDGPVECAHVRRGTDGGQGLKPSDRWSISLCQAHHAEQHQIGESSFEKRYNLDLLALATEFAAKSPHRTKIINEQAKDRP